MALLPRYSNCESYLFTWNQLQWRIQDFPLGGRRPVGGCADLRHVHFLAKMYAKMKEIDPVGGGCAPVTPPLDPPMNYLMH